MVAVGLDAVPSVDNSGLIKIEWFDVCHGLIWGKGLCQPRLMALSVVPAVVLRKNN
jgi:hypothetical protein